MSEIQNPQPNTDNVAKKSIKHIDAVVTGVILGGIIASIYGVSKLRDKDLEKDPLRVNIIEPVKPIERKSFWKRIFRRK